MIYDQYYLTSLGLAVTWDNPDIQLYLNGSRCLLIPCWQARLTKLSPKSGITRPMLRRRITVAFSFLEFGVSTVSVPIGSTSIDLGVKGGANCPSYATMSWTTPTTPGHYCLQVQLQPADDSNSLNNLGQENTNVGTAHSPAVFTFRLRNDTRQRQTYRFELDAYVPGAPDPCGPSNSAEDRRARLARHRRGAQPLPPGWQVAVDPPSPH